MSDERLKRLIARREAVAAEREVTLAKRQAIVDLAEEEARSDLFDEEDAEFRALTADIKKKDSDLAGLDERIQELSEEIQRANEVTAGAAAVRRAQASVQSVSEARTYERGNGKSYMADLMRSQLNLDGDGSARERLARHGREVSEDKDFRALNRTDATGGYFVPPLWVMQDWVALARSGRSYANLVPTEALPPGTDNINVPKVATGTSTAVQDGDNTSVSETDLTDTSVSAPVRTIAGQQSVAIQLLEQSPVNFDEVIFSDLIADYASKLDLQVISGSGSNGQVTGVRNTGSIETVTYTDATPTVGELYSKIADAVQRIHTLRFMPPTVIVMHPRRWAYFLAATDTTGRPLVTPGVANPQNAIAVLGEVAAQGVVGEMHGLPVVTDPNMPTTVSSTQDVIHVLRASDLRLWESGIRTRVLPEVGSGTLTTRLQVYGYLAFTAGRYPKSVAEISGTGLAAPTF